MRAIWHIKYLDLCDSKNNTKLVEEWFKVKSKTGVTFTKDKISWKKLILLLTTVAEKLYLVYMQVLWFIKQKPAFIVCKTLTFWMRWPFAAMYCVGLTSALSVAPLSNTCRPGHMVWTGKVLSYVTLKASWDWLPEIQPAVSEGEKGLFVYFTAQTKSQMRVSTV